MVYGRQRDHHVVGDENLPHGAVVVVAEDTGDAGAAARHRTCKLEGGGNGKL